MEIHPSECCRAVLRVPMLARLDSLENMTFYDSKPSLDVEGNTIHS